MGSIFQRKTVRNRDPRVGGCARRRCAMAYKNAAKCVRLRAFLLPAQLQSTTVVPDFKGEKKHSPLFKHRGLAVLNFTSNKLKFSSNERGILEHPPHFFFNCFLALRELFKRVKINLWKYRVSSELSVCLL